MAVAEADQVGVCVCMYARVFAYSMCGCIWVRVSGVSQGSYEVVEGG